MPPPLQPPSDGILDLIAASRVPVPSSRRPQASVSPHPKGKFHSQAIGIRCLITNDRAFSGAVTSAHIIADTADLCDTIMAAGLLACERFALSRFHLESIAPYASFSHMIFSEKPAAFTIMLKTADPIRQAAGLSISG